MITDKGKIGFIGGDRRMIECAKMFADHRFETAVCGFEKYTGDFGGVIKTDFSGALTRSSALVLPLPCCNPVGNINAPFSSGEINCEKLFDMIPCSVKVFGGKMSARIKELAKKKEITLFDYFDSEKLQILNAIPTAEGAICAVMQESPITLHGSMCLVTGYGRIAKLLCPKLMALGAQVTVAARNGEALTWAKACGCDTVHISELYRVVEASDFIFNTVPAPVITRQDIALMSRETVMIELASSPGGIDLDAARDYGVKVIHALGLPGKNSPKSAGMYISELLMENL